MDTLFAAYLLLHGVLACLVDAQSILPDVAPAIYALYESTGLTAVVAQWCAEEGDFLVKENPAWFKALIWSELFLQVPACFVLGLGWLREAEWVKKPSLVYSVHVLTTMVPIMGTLLSDPRPTTKCTAVYAVWVLLPLLLAVRCARAGDAPLFGAPPARYLWKIALRTDVEKWEASGALSGSDLDVRDGFLHASSAAMVRRVADMFFSGQSALLLRVDSRALTAPVTWVRSSAASDDKLRRTPRAGTAVRVLPDGCLHVHPPTERLLPMSAATSTIFELPWEGAAHVFPAECRDD